MCCAPSTSVLLFHTDRRMSLIQHVGQTANHFKWCLQFVTRTLTHMYVCVCKSHCTACYQLALVLVRFLYEPILHLHFNTDGSLLIKRSVISIGC